MSRRSGGNQPPQVPQIHFHNSHHCTVNLTIPPAEQHHGPPWYSRLWKWITNHKTHTAIVTLAAALGLSIPWGSHKATEPTTRPATTQQQP